MLFGPEDHGLANEELTRCQAHVVIPTIGYASLNLAQAVLVVAYEVALAARDGAAEGTGAGAAELAAENGVLAPAQPPGKDAATRDQMERFYAQLEAAMLHIGYTDPPRVPSVMRMYRGILDRANVSAHELAALRGLMSQTTWAADQPPERVPGNRTPASAEDPGAGPSDESG